MNDHEFLFEHEDLLHEITSLADALTQVSASCTSSRNTISFLSYELNGRVEQMKKSWLDAMNSRTEQALAA